MARIAIATAHRTIHLVNIVDYIITTHTKRAFYDIPGKTTPTPDADTFVVKPTAYSITANINDYEKAILIIMRGENDTAWTMLDNEQGLKNVYLDMMEFKINTGRGATAQEKWTVTLNLSGKDH